MGVFVGVEVGVSVGVEVLVGVKVGVFVGGTGFLMSSTAWMRLPTWSYVYWNAESSLTPCACVMDNR